MKIFLVQSILNTSDLFDRPGEFGAGGDFASMRSQMSMSDGWVDGVRGES